MGKRVRAGREFQGDRRAAHGTVSVAVGQGGNGGCSCVGRWNPWVLQHVERTIEGEITPKTLGV